MSARNKVNPNPASLFWQIAADARGLFRSVERFASAQCAIDLRSSADLKTKIALHATLLLVLEHDHCLDASTGDVKAKPAKPAREPDSFSALGSDSALTAFNFISFETEVLCFEIARVAYDHVQ